MGSRGEAPWAAIVVVDPDTDVVAMPELSSSYCVCASILAGNGDFVVVSLYSPARMREWTVRTVRPRVTIES